MDSIMTAKDISSYFIEKSSEVNENDLTNLKLQKILFYAQAEHLKATGLPLFDDDIEAWKYGPCISDVYNWLKGCGPYAITTFDVQVDSSNITDEDKEFLDDIWSAYGKYSAGYLVDKTHEQDAPWAKTYVAGRNNVIKLELIASAKLQSEW